MNSYEERFLSRHLGAGEADREEMLRAIGVESMDQLIKETVPGSILSSEALALPESESEHTFLRNLKNTASKNRVFKSYIGMGYYDCITPSVILRNVFENPGWYTPYTPYQAEIAQGRLEALLNFQTMVVDLTGMDVANASLLDEGTAAAEAMTMLHRVVGRKKGGAANTFLVSDRCFPNTIEVLKCRAEPLGIQLQIGDVKRASLDAGIFGALLSYPDEAGLVEDIRPFIQKAKEHGVRVAVASDLMSLVHLVPPGEMGADIVLGNSQRFGVPMGYGGPHAAFFAVRDEFKREAPGRIIGVSRDAHGAPAYRMALQTREQHIRREKAKSNICTAQALLATIAGFYAVYHGPEGLRNIAKRIHKFTQVLDNAFEVMGYAQENKYYFDTLRVRLDSGRKAMASIRAAALEQGINLRYVDDTSIGISIDETTNAEDIRTLIHIFAEALGFTKPAVEASSFAGDVTFKVPAELLRSSEILSNPVFSLHHSETEMMRYLKRLERKDVGLDTSMIPLGSCTMKLNAATQMIPVTWPEFSRIHPFVPLDQVEGYSEIIHGLEDALCKITGFSAASLQPNSGAQGEYAGLMVIRAYHHDRGDQGRDIVLIPSSAHGTNPATAVMAGMKVVVVACDDHGNVDVDDLRKKAEEHREDLAALMVTYPSTHGVFEEDIQEICSIIHERGGQVYMDGANLNAQVGITNPAIIGADVCHINLHKTFSIPHGGGGPGMGPIVVASHLAPFLPGHGEVAGVGGDKAIPSISSAPWGSSSILLISYAYIRLLGRDGVKAATEHAILNANYIKARLEKHFSVLFAGPKGRVAHEMIFDLRPFKTLAGVDETDVAKRLMDYGFHAPTVSWPVPGTMMIEPTESESRQELDRFCDALIAIRGEIQQIADGTADVEDNVLKKAPHTAEEASSDIWEHPYSRQQAVYPLPFVKENKFWPSVGRVDNPYGDRHLVCTCPGIENYEEDKVLPPAG